MLQTRQTGPFWTCAAAAGYTLPQGRTYCAHVGTIQYSIIQQNTRHHTLHYVTFCYMNACIQQTDMHTYSIYHGRLQKGWSRESFRAARRSASSGHTSRTARPGEPGVPHGSWSGAILTAFEAFSDLAMLNQPCVVQCGEHVGQKARSRIINSFSSLLHKQISSSMVVLSTAL